MDSIGAEGTTHTNTCPFIELLFTFMAVDPRKIRGKSSSPVISYKFLKLKPQLAESPSNLSMTKGKSEVLMLRSVGTAFG